jgi:hypothetical protein
VLARDVMLEEHNLSVWGMPADRRCRELDQEHVPEVVRVVRPVQGDEARHR